MLLMSLIALSLSHMNHTEWTLVSPALELRLAVLHHVDVELVGVAVAVTALPALVPEIFNSN